MKGHKTQVHYVRVAAIKGGRDRKGVAQRAVALSRAEGVRYNQQGNVITLGNTRQLLNAVVCDIRQPRAGWWSTFRVEEDGDGFRFVRKRRVRIAAPRMSAWRRLVAYFVKGAWA